MKRPWLFQQRNLLFLWLSEATSQIGTRMYSLALAWWILNHESENAGTKMSILMISAALPPVLFGKFFGPLIDRVRLRPFLMRAYGLGLAISLSLLLLFKFGQTHLGIFCLGAFAIACAQAMIDPSLQKAVPQIVHPRETERAVSLISTTTTLSSFAGALVGALVVATFGLIGTALVNAMTFGLAILLLGRVKFHEASAPPPVPDAPPPESPSTVTLSPILKKLLTGFGFFNFFLTPVLVVLPIYVQRNLTNSPADLGLLEGFLWAGFLAASVFAEKFGRNLSPVRAGALCFFGMSALLVAPALFQGLISYGISLFGLGLSCGAANIKFITYFHQIVPETQKGRFFALLAAAAGIASPAAFLSAGLLLDYTSLEFFALYQTLGSAAVASFFYRLSLIPAEKFAEAAP